MALQVTELKEEEDNIKRNRCVTVKGHPIKEKGSSKKGIITNRGISKDSFYSKQLMVKYSTIQCKDVVDNGGGLVPKFVDFDQVMMFFGISHKVCGEVEKHNCS